MANAFVAGRTVLASEEQALVEARARLLGPAYRLMYNSPLHFVKGEGVWLIDAAGRRYLDAYNNVTSLGHCHPAVVEAITKQVATLATNTRYLHEAILELADRLIATMPNGAGHLMLTCSGSEANDLAWRIARSATGGTGVIVTETAYHGITDAVAKFSPSLGSAVELGSHVALVPAPDGRTGDPCESFPRAVEAAAAKLQRHGVRPAMLIVDSMFTSDGILADPSGFLSPAAEVIRRAGGLFVADEVQSGFARTGGQMWGFQRHSVVPDIVTMGKPMGNGQPVAGLIVQPELVQDFGRRARYFNTFGGNPVSCAAALAVVDTIAQTGLMENVARMGERMRKQLRALAVRHQALGSVRGAGLLCGVEIVDGTEPDAIETARIVNGMRNRGVLISSCGRNHNILKIRPPLVVTEEHVDLLVGTLGEVLAAR
ncbi:aspartate aminotransferase family protein [Bradyrhizobium jicamae]|uniref:aspartate aminotransferase family protein n=1 Tax=Bradyrhizobium jicamae TaxID=280332 RepID=UPI001BA82241|nr:aspartate aminotransferase family protein [Bradyrhizobium jicamae]MBR0936053.1 aspartate aminotransferase family protein [Bradyrhizobium jicamae]